MVFGRQLDERGLQLQRQGRVGVWGPMIGQEGVQVGLGMALQPGDWVFPSYRECITLCIQGLDLVDLFAYYRGLYWPADPHQSGAFPIQIVIGDQSLHAVGAGMGFALQRQPHVAIGVIGDGATSEGDFLEALNFSGVFNAQTVMVVQNNQWAISMPRSRQTASQTLAQKGLAQGVTGVLVDGNDALAMYAVSHWAIERARQRQGPTLIEALTYRIGAHTTADDPRRYQPPDEIAAVARARSAAAAARVPRASRAVGRRSRARHASSIRWRASTPRWREAEARPIPSLERYIQAARPPTA